MELSWFSDKLGSKLVSMNYALAHYRRVLKRTKKPSKEEFLEVVKVTALGMLLMGFIGFLVQTLFVYVIKV